MTILRFRRIWALGLTLLAFFVTDLGAQIEPRISLVDRSTTRYHPSGVESLSRFTTNHMGGVLSQGVFNPADHTALFEAAYLALPEGADDYICVMVTDNPTCIRYDINYSELVPLVMWIGSGATSAFTLFDVDVHDEKFQRDAGFAPVRNQKLRRSMAALEFVGTPFEDILHYLDFCQPCVGPSDTSLVGRYNGRLSNESVWQKALENEELVRDWERSYINSDLDAHFAASIDENVITLIGQPARYQWRGFAESELRQMESVSHFLDSVESVQREHEERLKEFASAAKAIDVAIAAVDEMDEPSEVVRETLGDLASRIEFGILLHQIADVEDMDLHERGLWFFRTASLLRYFKDSDAARWRSFLASVQDRSDDEPAPWELYAAVYKEVYGSDPYSIVH